MECNGENNSKVVDSVDDLVAGSALNASVLNYYKKFGRKRDLEQYFSLSTAQSEIRDPTSVFWRKMKTQSDSDSGEKRSESSNEICRISIKCFAPDTEPSSSQDDNKEKEASQSPPIIMEEVNNSSRILDDSIRSDDDDQSQKSLDAALDTSTNKPLSPTSSITSQRKLEWDSLADVGYGNETDRKALGSSLSTLERLALKQQYSNNDTQQENIGVPAAHSTPQEDNDVKSKIKEKSTKFYNRDIERVEVNIPHASTSNPMQAINVNLTKHISFNVDQTCGVTVDNINKDISVKPNKVSVETEVTPQVKCDKEIQTSLAKSQDKSSSSGDLTNNARTYGRFMISLNSLRKRNRQKKLKNVKRIFRSRRKVVIEKEKIPMQEKSGEQVSEAESFEYMPGHIYHQNQLKHLSRSSNAAGNKSSLESSGLLTTDSSKTQVSFTRDLEKSVSLLKLALKNHEDSDLKKKLIKAIVQRLIQSTYRGDASSADFLSGLTFNTKLLGLSESNPTTSSTSDANTTREKSSRPKKSILRNPKFNPNAIASSSQSAPNLPSVSNSEKPVTTNLLKQLLSSNTDSDMSSKGRTSSDNAFAKTSSEELYQKYIDALKREDDYKRHLRDKEMFLKQKLVSSDSILKLPANLDTKSQAKLKDIIKDLTRNNYDDGSGDASKLEGGSNRNLSRIGSGKKLRSHSVFTLSSGNSEYCKNKTSAIYNDPGQANEPGSSRVNPNINVIDSSIQVNLDSKTSSSQINPLRSDYRDSKFSQTNVNLQSEQDDYTSSSGSSRNAPSSKEIPRTKQKSNILVHEATRSIQTQITINPKIFEPSLHDIQIISEDDCVSLICEHYREKSKSTIATADQQDNAGDYNESLVSDGTSRYNFRIGSSAPTEVEPNSDNFAIPIQGTNMTLMVSLNSNPVKIPTLQIPNEVTTQGTGTDKPYTNEKGTSFSGHSQKRTQSYNLPRNSKLTKPLVNTLFTRQNFLNEIYPNNNFPLTPQKRKKICNENVCHTLNPLVNRQNSPDTSENELNNCKSKSDRCNDNTCFKSSCSDNSCHKKIDFPPFCEPLKVDMGTNTETQSLPIKSSNSPRKQYSTISPTVPVPKSTCETSESQSPKKISAVTSTERPRKPVARTFETPKLPIIDITCAGTSTDSPRKLSESPRKYSAGTCTESPRKPIQRVYEPADNSSSEKKCAGKVLSATEIPKQTNRIVDQTSGSQIEKPPCKSPRIKHNEDCECPESSKCKDGPCGCVKEVPSCSPKRTFNKDCECPESSKCKDGACDCAKEVPSCSPRRTYNNDSKSPGSFKCNKVPYNCAKELPTCSPRVKYSKECECPESSKCKDSSCNCSKEVPKVRYNEDCKCPESSKCKDGQCNCIKVIPMTSKCNTYPKEIKITSRNISVRPNTLPSDCSVPKSIKIKYPQLQFKDYLNRLKKNDIPDSGLQKKTCDTDTTDCSTSNDLILEMIQDITKRYSKKDVAKSQRKKCFKEIMTILNYLLDTDESPDAEQLKVLISTTTSQDDETRIDKGAMCFCCRKKKACSTKTASSSSKCTECGCEMTSEKDGSASDSKPIGLTNTLRRQEVAYSVNVEADCACGAFLKKNEECTCKKKVFVDKGVQLSNRKLKSCDVKPESSDPVSSDLPYTSSDSATFKVLNKIKKECERYQQKRCMSHHSCKKCDASSSTSVNCDCCKCKRVHHCVCKNKCRGHRHKTDKHKKKCVAYNLIIQTSESMISEERSQDNYQPLKNVVVKVPPSNYYLNMPFKELANKIEDRIPGSPRNYSKAHRSRSLPNDSISSNDDNMKKVNAYSVRQYLEKNRPDFVEHCSRRQNCLKMVSESRTRAPCASAGQVKMFVVSSQDVHCSTCPECLECPVCCGSSIKPMNSCVDPCMQNCRNQIRRIASERASKIKLLSMQLQMDKPSPIAALTEDDLRRLAKELGIDSRHKKVHPKFISERDMKRHSERIYKSLPEVVRKKEEAKKENIKRTNLLMAHMFKKNLQKKTLSGSVNLPNHSQVVKI